MSVKCTVLQLVLINLGRVCWLVLTSGNLAGVQGREARVAGTCIQLVVLSELGA